MAGHETDNDIKLLNALDEKLKNDLNNVQLLIEKGFLLMEPFHNTNCSLALFQRAVELEPNNITALFWLAKSLFHDHFREEDAKKIMEHALQIDNNRAELHDFYAGILQDLVKDTEKSIVHLKKAIALEPTWLFPRIGLSYHLIDKGDLAQAEQEANEALKIFRTQKKCNPITPIEQYYEQCITGRETCDQATFDRLFAKVEEERKKLLT
jgi:tetratricopeptide (TPR) repeat protein